MNSRHRAHTRQKAMQRTSVVGALVNLLLAIGKIFFGVIGNSQALVADGVHSFADLSTEFMVWFVARYTSQPADTKYPYGNARIEALFTLVPGIVLLAIAAGIAWGSIQHLLNPELLLRPSPVVLLVAAVSIVANEGLYQYCMAAARKHKSSLLKANAWHHRSDAVSSVVVLLGVAGSLVGIAYLDAFAAVVVAFMVGKIGWEQIWSSVRELIDAGLDSEQLGAIKKLVKNIEGVRDVHMLRTRRMAGSTAVDFYIMVDEALSVSEGQRISEHVRHMLMKSNKNIVDVAIHIEPEDDEISSSNNDLPLRREVLADLRKVWAAEHEQLDLERMVLHYLTGQVHIEVFSRKQLGSQDKERLTALAEQIEYIGRVRFYFPL